MTTTPEQLQAWREEANVAYHNNVADWNSDRGAYVEGYLRAKQETEQALKDARKQALEEAIAEAILWANGRNPENGGLALLNYATRLRELLK